MSKTKKSYNCLSFLKQLLDAGSLRVRLPLAAGLQTTVVRAEALPVCWLLAAALTVDAGLPDPPARCRPPPRRRLA
jgi:hypothetical protein